MTRPAPRLLVTLVPPKRPTTRQEFYAHDGGYALTFQGTLCGSRYISERVIPDPNRDDPIIKYVKTLWGSIGTARMVAKRMNRMFKTKDFGVVRLIAGETVLLDD